ncbi:MAG: TrmH family RNA methyltransferase [Candidatus Promineifilaceae bacterium]
MITNPQNETIKYVRRLQSSRRFRRQEGAFVVEGTRWLAELAAAGVRPKLLLLTEAWLQEPAQARLVEQLAAPAQLTSAAALARASDLESPAGVLAVAPLLSRPLPDRPGLLLILDRIGDPGNMGAILRTAAAAAAAGVLLAPGCADIYNPKTLRGSMGALLRLPAAELDWEAIRAQTAGLAVWLATAGAETAYDAVDWRAPSAVIIGNEAHGPGADARRLASGALSIPMAAGSESLNAAMAAAVILFEAARQRRAEAAGD